MKKMLEKIVEYDIIDFRKEKKMKGITYYPQIDKKISSSTTKALKNEWTKSKKENIADERFIISGNLKDKAKELVQKIDDKAVKSQDYLYNTNALFDLLCAYTHVLTSKKPDNHQLLTLDAFVTDVVKQGANIEEIKFLSLASVFFNIDPIIDREGEDYDIVLSKTNFAFKLANTIDLLSKLSPYQEIFDKSEKIRRNGDLNSPLHQELAKDLGKYDLKNVEYITTCKLNSMLLEAILKYRTSYKDMNKSVLAEYYFMPRKDEGQNKAKGFFKYMITEKAKNNLLKLFLNPNFTTYKDIGARYSADRMFTPDEYLSYRSVSGMKDVCESVKDYLQLNDNDERE